jgi:hypothetical protein
VGTAAVVLAQLPDDIERDQVEWVIIGLLVLCALAAVLVLRTVQKVATRLMLLGLLFLVGIGLWVQREQLQDCRNTCTCRVFGQDVRMPDTTGLNCPQ